MVPTPGSTALQPWGGMVAAGWPSARARQMTAWCCTGPPTKTTAGEAARRSQRGGAADRMVSLGRLRPPDRGRPPRHRRAASRRYGRNSGRAKAGWPRSTAPPGGVSSGGQAGSRLRPPSGRTVPGRREAAPSMRLGQILAPGRAREPPSMPVSSPPCRGWPDLGHIPWSAVRPSRARESERPASGPRERRPLACGSCEPSRSSRSSPVLSTSPS